MFSFQSAFPVQTLGVVDGDGTGVVVGSVQHLVTKTQTVLNSGEELTHVPVD